MAAASAVVGNQLRYGSVRYASDRWGGSTTIGIRNNGFLVVRRHKGAESGDEWNAAWRIAITIRPTRVGWGNAASGTTLRMRHEAC